MPVVDVAQRGRFMRSKSATVPGIENHPFEFRVRFHAPVRRVRTIPLDAIPAWTRPEAELKAAPKPESRLQRKPEPEPQPPKSTLTLPAPQPPTPQPAAATDLSSALEAE